MAYFSMGLATLSKGPVAILLPALSVFLFLLWKREFNFKSIQRFRIGLGAVIVLVLTVPVFLLLHIKTGGEWTTGFFLKHNVSRFLSPMEGHGGFFLAPLIFTIAGMFPFSVFIVQAVKKTIAERKDDSFLVFSAIVALTVIVFFTLSKTKLPNYTLPAYPFLAVIIGIYLEGVCAEGGVCLKKIKLSLNTLFAITALFPAIIWTGLKYTNFLPGMETDALSFVPMFGGVLLGYVFALKKKALPFMLSIAAGTLLSVSLLFTVTFPKINALYPVNVCQQELSRADKIAYWGEFAPAFSFNLKKKIPKLEDEAAFESFAKNNPNGLIISTVRQLKKYKGNYLEYTSELFSGSEIFENRTTVLLKPLKQ